MEENSEGKIEINFEEDSGLEIQSIINILGKISVITIASIFFVLTMTGKINYFFGTIFSVGTASLVYLNFGHIAIYIYEKLNLADYK